MARRARRFLVVFCALAVVAHAGAGCNWNARETSSGEAQDRLELGQILYTQNCATCHGGGTGGVLKDIPPPHNANGHTWHHPDQQLKEMVLDGITFSLEEQKMPAFKDTLTEADVEAILAYVKTWWTQEQKAFQATVTAEWRSR